MAVSKEVLKLCICQGCPTYTDCGEDIGFCFHEKKSKCIKDQRGCVCSGCPVTKKFGLKHMYYCIWGPEKEQLKK